jgi:biotin transport system substrate-specific component
METIMKRELISDQKLCRLLGVGAFIILTSLSAFVRIPLPFTPVPLTLQTFFVLLSGALLGSKLGSTSQLAYLLLGLTGYQVFTGTGSGALYLLGPTGGYIVGFVCAAFLVGRFLRADKQSWFKVFVKLLAADFIILFSGTLWLKLSLSCQPTTAFLLGFLPFVPGDILKVILAAIVYHKIGTRVKSVIY